jgi:hypothetical protein
MRKRRRDPRSPTAKNFIARIIRSLLTEQHFTNLETMLSFYRRNASDGQRVR